MSESLIGFRPAWRASAINHRCATSQGSGARFDFLELEAFGILFYILDGGFKARIRPQRDELVRRQEYKGSSLVGRIVGNGDKRAGGDIVKLLEFSRVEPQWFNMHGDNALQGKLSRCGEGLEVGQVLEKINVQLAFGQGDIGRHVIGKLDYVQTDPLLSQIGLYDVEDFGMGDRGGAYLQACLRHRAAEGR